MLDGIVNKFLLNNELNNFVSHVVHLPTTPNLIFYTIVYLLSSYDF